MSEYIEVEPPTFVCSQGEGPDYPEEIEVDPVLAAPHAPRSEPQVLVADTLSPKNSNKKTSEWKATKRKSMHVPEKLFNVYKEKWTEKYGERGMTQLLEKLVPFFDEI